MIEQIQLKINGKKIICNKGDTILYAAFKNKIFVPALCFHPDFPSKGNCRVCVVEIKGRKDLVTSCSTLAEEGMEVFTESPRVKKARNINLELIFAEHVEKCAGCVWRFECTLLKLADKYQIPINRIKERKSRRKIHKFANAVEIDGTQCIDCRNCLDACSLLQKIDYLELDGKGSNQEIVPTKDKSKHCILCGQCALHCPVSSAQEQIHYPEVEKLLKNRNKILVAQFAPSIRVSIGEDFNFPPGQIVTEQIITALKKLGFNYVFDVNFGADITTMIEAEELLERIKQKKNLPMITSCCPSWVLYTEFYHPELIPNLTTARSPHIHSGGAIKTYFAEKKNLNPKDIIVVSIMPCTSKKYESIRPELKINGFNPVDYVLTTREFSFLLKKNQIDLSKLNKTPADSLLGKYSGAAAIYGGSGGVMESALRTANFFACGKDLCSKRIEFKEVRGLNGIKESVVDLAGRKLRVAVVNGIGNIKPLLENLKKYDYVEVMACPGGCIGGGGQPIPTNRIIREKRIAALYEIDKKSEVRKAHENKGVLEVLSWLKNKGKLYDKTMYTFYKRRKDY